MNLYLWPSNLVPCHLHNLYWPSRHQLSSNQYSASILSFDPKFMQKLSRVPSWVTGIVWWQRGQESTICVKCKPEWSQGERIYGLENGVLCDLDLWLWNLRVTAHFTHKDCWCMKYEPDWTRREKICFKQMMLNGQKDEQNIKQSAHYRVPTE